MHKFSEWSVIFIFLIALPACGSSGEGNDRGANTASTDTTSTDTTSAGLPLIYLEDFDFEGGFRIKSTGGIEYSKARIGYNNANHSLFVSGTSGDRLIAEFPIPDLVKSDNYKDYSISGNPIQGFSDVMTGRTDTGFDGSSNDAAERIGAIYYDQNELLVHTFATYDNQPFTTQTSLVVRDASNLSGSNIDGFFELQGAAHLTSWISPIPGEWQTELGADLISGNDLHLSINSRASMGPSLFTHNSSDVFGNAATSGTITTEALMDWDLSHIMFNNAEGWTNSNGWDSTNDTGENDLNTEVASGKFGFILPGTRTYAVFGKLGMGYSGGGYKVTQVGGDSPCGGYCSRIREDRYPYYWFFDVNDLLEVKNGTKQPYEVKPYSYGMFPMIADGPSMGGGTYDDVNDLIYLSLSQLDKDQTESKPPPVIVAYSYSKKTDYSHLLNEKFYSLWIRSYKFIKTGTNSAGEPDWSNSVETSNFSVGDKAHIYWRSRGFDECTASSGPWIGDNINKIGYIEVQITSADQNQDNYEITCSNKRTGHTVTESISLAISG